MNATVRVTQQSSTCRVLTPHFFGLLVGEEIEIGAEIGSGAFGTVFECALVGSTGTVPLVIKRHQENNGVTPEQCAGVLAALHRTVDDRWVANPAKALESFAGMPFWVGRVQWGADDAVVSISQNLSKLGYQPFEPILERPESLRRWLALDIGERVRIARAFAACHAACEEIGFVHADINVGNVFVDVAKGRATLIDFDCGWLPGSPHLRPLTWGKPDDFIAPEVKAGGRLRPEVIGTTSERWAVGWMIHYLLFGAGPLFFLAQLSDDAVARYVASFTWPDIDHSSALFNRPNRSFYGRYLTELAELPDAAVEIFRTFVHEGALSADSRPSSTEWCEAFDSLARPPVFELVRLSSDSMLWGHPITVAWIARDATSVTINGAGPFAGTGRATIVTDRTGALRLVARNPFGEAEHVTARIRVYRGPVLGQLRTTLIGRPPTALVVVSSGSLPGLPQRSSPVGSHLSRITWLSQVAKPPSVSRIRTTSVAVPRVTWKVP